MASPRISLFRHLPFLALLCFFPLAIPAYEATLRCSHLFNVLDARGAFSVTERAAYIQRIRSLSCRCARAWVEGRTAAGFPLLGAAASGGTSS